MFRSPVFSATLLITGVTIGAGVLGLPFALAPLGIWFASVYIIALGIVMLMLNLMISDVAFALGRPLQLPGLAFEILGKGAQRFLSVISMVSWFGALVAYMVGGGMVLASLFGGLATGWSYAFWILGSLFVAVGFKAVTGTMRWLSLVVMALLIVISGWALPLAQGYAALAPTLPRLALPFGVVLFALHGAPAISAAHELLRTDRTRFRRAVCFGTFIPLGLYLVFTLAVLSVTGLATTPVATVGLSSHLGFKGIVLGSVCALLVMTTAYLGIGLALRETLTWDSRLPTWLALVITIGVPGIVFSLGIRDFSRILELIGGVLIASEAVLMIVVYARAVQRGIIMPTGFVARHPWLVGLPLMAIFLLGGIASLSIR